MIRPQPRQPQYDRLVVEERRGRLAQDAVGELARPIRLVCVVEILVGSHVALPSDDDGIVSPVWSSKMSVDRIECANDARAAAYRDLGDGELLREHGLFVAE